MKHFILSLALLAACATTPQIQTAEEPNNIGTWPAPIEFCMRHTEAAKTDPIYLVDICVIECELRPAQIWCEDTRKILDDQRRHSTDPN